MEEEQLELWNFCKELDDIVSSTYYYSKEKYRSICEEIANEIWKENYRRIKDFYSRNPNKFAEDYLGIKLKWYQKVLLEIIDKKTNLLWHIGRS
jgi:hypothetical protein